MLGKDRILTRVEPRVELSSTKAMHHVAKPRVVTSDIIPLKPHSFPIPTTTFRKTLRKMALKQIKQHKLKSLPSKPKHQYPTRSSGQELIAQAICLDHAFQLLTVHVRDDNDDKLSIRKLQQGPLADTCITGLANKWGQLLTDGVGQLHPVSQRIKGTKTIYFVYKTTIPSD